MKLAQYNKIRGFTLIELLIVIVILGVLGSVVIASFTSSQKAARDANRKSDLSQFRNALEAYANKNSGLYPIHTNYYSTSTLCSSDLGLSITCPVDPKTGNAYTYRSDSGGTKYIVYASIEKPPNGYTNYYFGLCSTGNAVEKGSAPRVTDCP